EQTLLVVVERVPRAHGVRWCRLRHVLGHRIDRREPRVLRHDALVDHARENPCAVRFVAVVELALVLVGVVLGRLVWRGIGAGTEPHEPGLRRVGVALIAEHSERLIREILREMVSVLHRIRLIDGTIVLYEIRMPVVLLSAEKSVEAIESFLQRPFALAAAGAGVFRGNVVILAQPERAVAVILQYLSERRTLGGETARGAGEAVRRLGDRRATIHVMVAAGEEGGVG